MIKLVQKKKSNKKHIPVYNLKINYMIGDANGYTSEEETFPIESADVLEKFCKILDKLKPLKGTWGIVFDGGLDKWFKEEQITQEDMDFWDLFVNFNFDESELDEETNDILDKIGDSLGMLITGETEYSFLVYQNYELTYYDENNVKHNTYFE